MTIDRSARRALASPLALFAASAAAQTPNQPGAAVLPVPAAPVIALPPAPAPTPRPTPRSTPAPRPSASPAARATPQARPAAARPTPAPRATATPSPSASATPTPAPIQTAAPARSVAAPSDLARTPEEEAIVESPRWWASVLAILALIAGAVFLARDQLRRRRARRQREADGRRPQVTVAGAMAGTAPEPSPGGVDAPTFWTPSRPIPAPVPPSSPPPATRARLTVALRPRRAGVNLVSATADIELTVRNVGDGPAEEIAVAVRLLAGRAGQDGELGELFAGEPGRPAFAPFALAPGEERVCRTTLVLPRAGIEPIVVGARPMFVPVVAVDVRHRRADGGRGQNAAAYVVGAVRAGGDKLAPFWLDAAPRMRDEVEARPHGPTVES